MKAKKTVRNIIIAVLVIALLVCAYMFALDKLHSSVTPEKGGQAFTLAEVREDDIEERLSGTGTLQPKNSYNIVAPSEVEGRIVKADFKVGDEVKKNEVLYEIEPTEDSDKKDKKKNYKIKSPVKGTIITKTFKKGDSVAAGGASGTLAVIYDMSSMFFQMNIDELDIKSIKKGQNVTVKADAVPDKSYKGEITEISLAGVTNGGVTEYPVTVKLDSCKGLLPAMNVTGEVLTKSKDDVLVIPSEALMRGDVVYVKRSSTELSGSEPYISTDKDEDGIPDGFNAVEVETGITTNTQVEIKKGLDEGDKIFVPARTMQNELMQMMRQGMNNNSGSTGR